MPFKSKYLFNTYRPLAYTALGRKRAVEYELPPFIDGSCRREPDFQMSSPAISALCRSWAFAPKLDVGHHIVYCAKKAAYKGKAAFWCLTALLKVEARFDDHWEAAAWYMENEGHVPSNCMIDYNPPIKFEKTLGYYAKEEKEFKQNSRYLQPWDNSYKRRAETYPAMFACKVIECALEAPIIVTPEMVSKQCPSRKLPNSYHNKFEITEADWNWFQSLFRDGQRLDL